jgi:glutamate/tyrosine decarboxylase-like PLP-dependent enzyme
LQGKSILTEPSVNKMTRYDFNPHSFADDPAEESLDPADWDNMRALGHRMVEDIMDYLETVRDRPVWKPIPEEVKTFFKQPLPQQPQGDEQTYRDFRQYVLPHPMGTIHPRFWAWVIGTGTPFGALAEMLAAAMNPNLGGAEHVANYVERQVIDWCKQMLGYPAAASGLLVSGGSMANLVGLTVARNTMAEIDVRQHGVAAAPRKMTLYGSAEMHSSVQKAVELLGLGHTALRKIAVDADYAIDIGALTRAIAEDRDAGHFPFCIVGNAGTVNTGAFDDLKNLALISKKENLWFHVDGAFGALAALSPDLSDLTAGMQLADSLAFDLHKWMYMPIEVGCALVCREQDHRRAFSLTPEYLSHGGERGLMAGSQWFSDYGLQLSRGFRALKVWMSLKAHGIDKYARLIRQNVRQAQYLSARIDEDPQLERLAPTPLNIVCFRFKAEHRDEDVLNRLNEELLIRLHESGWAAPSYTTLNGRYAIRVAITNHRSRKEDFDVLVREVKRIGGEILDEAHEID